MVCEKHTVAVFFFYLWSLIIFPNYVEPKIRNYHSIHD